jgi:hypothetical protein
VPDEWLADGGFAKHDHIEQLEARGSKVFAPVLASKDKLRDRYAPLPSDSQALSQWRERMGSAAAKLTYKERAASIECTNAHLRNRNLQRFNVRGLRRWGRGPCGPPLRRNRPSINATSPHTTNFVSNLLVAIFPRTCVLHRVESMAETDMFTGSQPKWQM